MKQILLVVILLLNACDGSSAPTPKIAEPQREALEKAKGVDQILQKGNEETQEKISESEGKQRIPRARAKQDRRRAAINATR